MLSKIDGILKLNLIRVIREGGETVQGSLVCGIVNIKRRYIGDYV